MKEIVRMNTNILKTKDNEILNKNKKVMRMYKPISSQLEAPDLRKLNYMHDKLNELSGLKSA
jgi:hypothetical protein